MDKDKRYVFVLVYRHRHGEDVSVFETEDLAIHAGANIAMDYLHEVAPGDARHMTDLFKQDKFGDVVDAYVHASGDEQLDIHGPLLVQVPS
jgi:hypothetical protein